MVNIDILEEEYGLTQEFFREVLGGDLAKKEVKDDNYERRVMLRNRIRSRIDEGMIRNFQSFRVYHALDLAWDTPFRQISPTLVQHFADKDVGDKEVVATMESWGLTSMLHDERDPKTDTPTGKKVLNLPIFNQIFVPLCISYVSARWAAIVNDARLTPFFKYEPAKLRMDYKVKCDAITDRVDVMDRQFGYFNTYKQATFRMLHYGSVYQFPQEEWYSEEQMRIATDEDVAAGQLDQLGKPVKKGDLFSKVVKEGLRYHLPHPARTYRDLSHPACEFLTDTGPEYAGYWKIIRYRDIAYNTAYYNSDQIGLADKNIMDLNRIFFQTVYGACTLTYPTLSVLQGGEGVSQLDREKQVSNLYYGTDHFDQGILVTEHWEKVNPKRDGLVNYKSKRGMEAYDGPVWFRFVVAGTNGTIIYAAPVPSVGPLYAGYDADEGRTTPQSLTLQVLPFQDAIGNVLSQMVLSMKQNLANMVMIDEDQVSAKDINTIQNLGERFLRKLNFVRFTSSKAKKAQHQVPAAATPFSFPKANLQEQVQTITMLLQILERLIGVSSQETAQAASHEQTREEIINIGQQSSNRLTFTKTPMEQLRDAEKAQIYNYTMTYGEDAFWAEVPCDREVTPEQLRAWGFETENLDVKHGGDRHIRVKFDRRKTALPEWAFASTRDGDDRYNDPQIAQAMTQFVQVLLNNPMTAPAIGPTQAIALANVIAQYAGLPRDFKLRSLMKDGEQPNPQAAQQVLQEVMKQVTPALQQMSGQIQQIGQSTQAVGAVQHAVQQLGQQLEPLAQQSQQNASAIAKVMQTLQSILPAPVAAPTVASPNGNPNQPASPVPVGQ